MTLGQTASSWGMSQALRLTLAVLQIAGGLTAFALFWVDGVTWQALAVAVATGVSARLSAVLERRARFRGDL